VTRLVPAFRGYRPDSENGDMPREKVGRAEEEEHLLLGLDRNDDVAQAELYIINEDEVSGKVICYELTIVCPSYLTSCRFPHQLLAIQKKKSRSSTTLVVVVRDALFGKKRYTRFPKFQLRYCTDSA